MTTNHDTGSMSLGEAIEKILIESGMSISAFSRKVGYSRQYIYELLRSKDVGFSRKIQLDTLKKICDATGYGLERLLVDIGYLPKPMNDMSTNTVFIVKRSGEKVGYPLDERQLSLIAELARSLEKGHRDA